MKKKERERRSRRCNRLPCGHACVPILSPKRSNFAQGGWFHSYSIYRERFLCLFSFFSSFFLFYPPFLPRFFAFCFLRSSFVFSFFLFFCVSSYREGILVKYQMRHFYRGFIASTSDKFLGIKVENPRCTRLRILSDLIGWMCLVPSYRS